MKKEFEKSAGIETKEVTIGEELKTIDGNPKKEEKVEEKKEEIVEGKKEETSSEEKIEPQKEKKEAEVAQ